VTKYLVGVLILTFS